MNIHKAAKIGDLAAVKALLAAGIDVNSENEWGNTPLLPNERGNTPLHVVSGDCEELVDLLLASGQGSMSRIAKARLHCTVLLKTVACAPQHFCWLRGQT